MRRKKNYLDYILNPLELLRTRKVLHVNPTVTHHRRETVTPHIMLHDYDRNAYTHFELKDIRESFPHLDTPNITWINIAYPNFGRRRLYACKFPIRAWR